MRGVFCRLRRYAAFLTALAVTAMGSFAAPYDVYALTGVGSGSEVTAAYAADTVKVPEVAAPAAALIDADTGEFLYEKDAGTRYYPASITKIMTALIVLERCGLDEVVTLSKKATTDLESGAVTVYLTQGDRLTVRDCLYALLLRSANEVANALAEHAAGSVEAFAELMNKKAAQLGCTGTHFVNPNGLNDKDHYTTAHDMALIGRAAFANETLRQIDTTMAYRLPATKNYPGGFLLKLSNKILNPASPCHYEYAIGSKTGYTSKAGNTLVTCARKDGKTLVCVILKSTKSLGQYEDTKNLCDYGFNLKAQSSIAEQVTQPGQVLQQTESTDNVIQSEGPGQGKPSPGNAVTEAPLSDAAAGPGSTARAELKAPGDRNE